MPLDVALLEPWFRGSHRQWAEGWQRTSNHRIHVVGSSDERWRRGLLTNPHELAAGVLAATHPIDVVVASSPLDLMATAGLARARIADTPLLLYLHESQVAYPPGPKGGQARGAMAVDWRSMAGADCVLVASQHHRRAIQASLPDFVAELHDRDTTMRDRAVEIAAAVRVAPVGVELPPRRDEDPTGPLRILWNHRWAHDKAPERFVHAVQVLAGEGFEFQIIALGEIERSGRPAFERLCQSLPGRLLHSGRADDDLYGALLYQADLVVSTSRHEFFGVAVVEAIAAGARPVLPARLSYPELVPPQLDAELLYRGELADALRPLLATPRAELHRHRDRLRHHVEGFSWEHVAPTYDALVDAAAAGEMSQ